MLLATCVSLSLSLSVCLSLIATNFVKNYLLHCSVFAVTYNETICQ